MASIQVRIDGRFHPFNSKTKGRGTYYIDHRDLSQFPAKRKRTAVGTNLNVAKRELAEIEVRMDKIRNGHIDPTEDQFSEVSLDEFEQTALPQLIANLADGTRTRYRGVIGKLLTYIHEKRRGVHTLREIDSDVVEHYLVHLRTTPISPNGHPHTAKREKPRAKTVETEAVCLSAVFNRAVKKRLIVVNPVSGLIPQKERPEPYHPLDADAGNEIIARAYERCGENYGDLIVIAFNTGCRSSELRYLRWQDVDFKHRHIYICKHREDDFTLKTHEARTIPINDTVMDLLQRMKQRKPKVKYVFGPGEVVWRKKFLDPLKRIGESLGIAGMKMHTLRHEFLSALVMAGVPIPTVARLAGHKSVLVTMDYYVHLSPEHMQDAVNKVTFGSPSPQTVTPEAA